MFSCCCAIVDRTWRGICGCHSGITNTCENKCLRDESRSYKNSYYEQLKVRINTLYIYIWFISFHMKWYNKLYKSIID